MSGSDIQRLKVEIEKQEKTLTDLYKKWDKDSTLKRLSKRDQPTVIRAVVSAKRLATVLIPKLKFKIDLSLRTPSDGRLRETTSQEWNSVRPKIESTLRDFEIIEIGKTPEYPSKEQKQRDETMSNNIEKFLKGKRVLGKFVSNLDDSSSSRSQVHEDGRGDMGRNVGIRAKSDSSGSARNSGTGDGSGPSASTSRGNDAYGKKLVENVRNFKHQLSAGRESKGLSEIVDDVCLDDAASVKEYIRSLAASETPCVGHVTQEMLDEIRGLDADEVDRRKAERNKKLSKSNEIREKRIRRIEKLAETQHTFTRSSIPSPLPIDGFLDTVESLPREIQKLITEETETLSDYYKNQIFLKKEPISSRQGKLINMNNLKHELKDGRFDAGDFHIRAPDSVIAQKNLKRLKEQRIDNAVGRIFGTFSSQGEDRTEESLSPKPPYAGDMKLSSGDVE